MDWNGNMVIVNSSQLLFPCSCQNVSAATGNFSESGFCEAQTPDWPVYDVVSRVFSAVPSSSSHPPVLDANPACVVVFTQGCADSVESWLLTNIGVVLGICLGVALIEVNHSDKN